MAPYTGYEPVADTQFSCNVDEWHSRQSHKRTLGVPDCVSCAASPLIKDCVVCRSAIIENIFIDRHPNILQLGDVGSYIRGLTYNSNDVVEQGNVLVMRSNNIINGSSLDYNNNIVSVNKQISAEQQLQNGDIIICMANGSSSLVG